MESLSLVAKLNKSELINKNEKASLIISVYICEYIYTIHSSIICL